VEEGGQLDGDGEKQVEDGGQQEDVDDFELKYVDDDEDSECESFSDEGLIDINIQCDTNSDMDNQWDGNVQYEMESVVEDLIEISRAKSNNKSVVEEQGL